MSEECLILIQSVGHLTFEVSFQNLSNVVTDHFNVDLCHGFEFWSFEGFPF